MHRPTQLERRLSAIDDRLSVKRRVDSSRLTDAELEDLERLAAKLREHGSATATTAGERARVIDAALTTEEKVRMAALVGKLNGEPDR